MTRARLVISTPLGAPLVLESNGSAIVHCAFTPRARRGDHADPILDEASAQLRAYFARRLARFDLPLALEGTPFSRAVWSCVAALSRGEIVSYADIARAVGAPLAHRGVAAAMGRAPFDLLIPAHRVIGADGRIKGAGADSMRRRLLAFEGVRLAGDRVIAAGDATRSSDRARRSDPPPRRSR